MQLLFVTGARPNFIKIKVLIDKCEEESIPYLVYNSGQHSGAMQVFPMGDHAIDVPSISNASRSKRMALMSLEFSNYLDELDPKETIVVIAGDTDTSMITAIVAQMNGFKIAHVEAGKRSFYDMPEEHNRRIIDSIATWNFVAESRDIENLLNERTQGETIHAGNIMIESLINQHTPVPNPTRDYILMEIHRAENDHNVWKLGEEFAMMAQLPVKWVTHPRYVESDYYYSGNVTYLPPMAYTEMLQLVANAALVITDSGGLQVDSSFIGTPCITFRKSTEWMTTVELGINRLMSSVDLLIYNYGEQMRAEPVSPYTFKTLKWDDKVSTRILKHILQKD